MPNLTVEVKKFRTRPEVGALAAVQEVIDICRREHCEAQLVMHDGVEVVVTEWSDADSEMQAWQSAPRWDPCPACGNFLPRYQLNCGLCNGTGRVQRVPCPRS